MWSFRNSVIIRSQKMRLSRSGIYFLVIFAVLSNAGCGYYNQVIMRKNLVDGSNAYKNRKLGSRTAFSLRGI